jgi:hypothetical protein
MKFTQLNNWQPLNTPEKIRAYDLALCALTMRLKNPGSKLWRMRVKQALDRLEAIWGQHAIL